VITIFVLIFCCLISVFAKTDGNGSLVYESDNSNTFDPGVATYSRIICLKNSGDLNGTLLCTYDQLKNVSVDVGNGEMVSKQVYPIYRSSDNGESWQLISNVYDKEYGLLRTSQPCLYELPQQVGNMHLREKMQKVIDAEGLPDVVFHSIRHTGVTYKLKLSGGDIKAVQGDSDHAQADMVTEVYGHILDEDRRKNAERMENAFYNKEALNLEMRNQGAGSRLARTDRCLMQTTSH